MHIWTLPVLGGTPRQLTDAPARFRDWYPCWSTDGETIAFMRSTSGENWAEAGEGNISVVSADGCEPRRITSESDRIFDAAPVMWSPDGKLLAYFSRDKRDAPDGTIKVIPATGGEPRIVTKVRGAFANKEMAWSPGNRRIAYNELRGDTTRIVSNMIKVVSLDDGSTEEIVPDLKDVKEIYHLDWSPDGKTLVFAGYTGGWPEFWTVGNFLPLARTER
ncbi:MAG: PD40 domain-containing protein [Acidobacteria bacterium]|nr:PD40 domain-containing protein [Acidobacteriota bacterium]